MSRRLYVALFMLLAICLVPVLFFLGFFAFIAPTGWGFAITFVKLAKGDQGLALVFSIHALIYTAVFYGLARLSFGMIARFGSPHFRIFAQVMILWTLRCCSFPRQITYGGFGGRGGTYNFWGAVERAIEKRAIW